MVHLPQKFIQTIVGVHGEAGHAWLKNLDSLVAACRQRWSLQLLPPFELSYNYVLPVVMPGDIEAVLKLYVDPKQAEKEKRTLEAFDRNGTCALVAADLGRGALLLERLKPGYNLTSIEDESTSIRIAIDIIKQQRSVETSNDHGFVTTADWFRDLKSYEDRFRNRDGPIDATFIRKAQDMSSELWSSSKTARLLHGDLHHENILSAQRKPWLSIDPKGVIGETEYEVVPFLMNNLSNKNIRQTLRIRVKLFAQLLNLDAKRIYQWAFCHSVLSAWWCIEDSMPGVAEILSLTAIFEELMDG